MTIKDLPKPLRIDLACGQDKAEGWYGVDIANCPGVDMILDLDKYPWPFEDNSVDELRTQHFVEHVKDLQAFMNECYRIMKVGAKITIQAPYYNSVRCWQDPTHIRAISENTFLYYNKAWRTESKLTHYDIKADFDIAWTYALDHGWANIWGNMDQCSRDYAVRHYTNVVDDIIAFLTKRDPNAKLEPYFTGKKMILEAVQSK